MVFVSFEPNSMYFDLCIKIRREAISILQAPVACDPIVLSLYDGIFVLTLSSVKFNRPSFCLPPPRSLGASSGLTSDNSGHKPWANTSDRDSSSGEMLGAGSRHQDRNPVARIKNISVVVVLSGRD